MRPSSAMISCEIALVSFTSSSQTRSVTETLARLLESNMMTDHTLR